MKRKQRWQGFAMNICFFLKENKDLAIEQGGVQCSAPGTPRLWGMMTPCLLGTASWHGQHLSPAIKRATIISGLEQWRLPCVRTPPLNFVRLSLHCLPEFREKSLGTQNGQSRGFKARYDSSESEVVRAPPSLPHRAGSFNTLLR